MARGLNGLANDELATWTVVRHRVIGVVVQHESLCRRRPDGAKWHVQGFQRDTGKVYVDASFDNEGAAFDSQNAAMDYMQKPFEMSVLAGISIVPEFMPIEDMSAEIAHHLGADLEPVADPVDDSVREHPLFGLF